MTAKKQYTEKGRFLIRCEMEIIRKYDNRASLLRMSGKDATITSLMTEALKKYMQTFKPLTKGETK